MANVVDMVEMKHRVAATEAMLSAAAQDEKERNARLLNFLERVEQNLMEKQEQIDRLEKEQNRVLEENRLLRTLLQDMLNMAETSFELSTGAPSKDLDRLIDRLGTIAADVELDGDIVAKGDAAKEAPLVKDASESAAEPGKDAAANAAKPGQDTDARPTNGAKATDDARSRKRRVSKVLSLFAAPQS